MCSSDLYEEAGENEGLQALAALSRHPSTARFVATKFARHFVSDRPPDALIGRLSRLFLDTDGDLGALSRALVEGPEAWADTQPKVKSTNDFVVSALRATGFAGEPRTLVQALRLLGQAPYAAPSPAGWPDVGDQWIGPEAVIRRAEWAMAVGNRAAAARAPLDMFEATIAPIATRETRLAVERAPSAGDAIALVLASPEFQRR